VLQIVHGVHPSVGEGPEYIKVAIQGARGCPPSSDYKKRKIYICARIHYLIGRNSEVKNATQN
jgi:hypothetical protein